MAKSDTAKLTVYETEETITRGRRWWEGLFHDRTNYKRGEVLTKALNVWRTNPLGKRIIEITTGFVLGDGFTFTCAHERASRFLNAWWNDPLNDIEAQLPEWADEAWRSGDLFLLFSVDASGWSYVRALPAEMVGRIETAENDYRQEKRYILGTGFEEKSYPAYDPDEEQEAFVLHFALNRAVGNSFGESDLTSVVRWIAEYKRWLDDRITINHFRQVFSFVVNKHFENDAKRQEFANKWTGRTPNPGSVLITETDETWSVLNPQLASHEAGEDGLALKRMIAAGAGLPMHYLAEPEGSTRTTAEAAGTPTFKRFKQRQNYLRLALKRVLTVALEVERRTNRHIPRRVELEIVVPDITERDNANLSMAVQRIVTAFAPLYNARLVDSRELLRLVYRFLAETPPAPADAPASPFLRIDPAARPDPLPEEPDL